MNSNCVNITSLQSNRPGWLYVDYSIKARLSVAQSPRKENLWYTVALSEAAGALFLTKPSLLPKKLTRREGGHEGDNPEQDKLRRSSKEEQEEQEQ